MQFAIRHFIRGRLRINIPSLCRKRELAEATLAWLRRQDGVRLARINYDCASLVLEYDPSHEPSLRLLLGHLRLMSCRDLQELIALGHEAGDFGPHTAKDEIDAKPLASKRFPLVLPTISLALTFSINPLLRAVNVPLMVWNAYPSRLGHGASGKENPVSTSTSSIRLQSQLRSP